eukprot:CAMPEP_0113576724 /NCGR_PEP_ID=MMETSP0015_2-20120614/28465_1 /TAXON_ID=2838 /ORGANISM="Odontella" /LENGTH=412 /DNA_ID=CAMNT_0000480211 /DNA_START=443 /DNA_END=1677 /DNA_ORIENTATION=+ /assembly_acc=CAM_ASM_000160
MSPHPHNAQRRNGACYGTLYKQHTSVTVPPNLSYLNLKDEDETGSTDAVVAALDSNERGRSHDYCVLVGNTLISYESWHCYRRGDHPTSEVRIVGASAWNPPAPKGTVTSTHPTGSSSVSIAAALTPPPKSPQQAPQPSPGAPGASGAPPSGPPTFRLVTYAGTHIYCSAPTPSDRDTWLAALHSGLEASYASYHETLSSITASPGGTRKKHILPLSVINAADNDRRILTPPVPQRRGVGRLGHALRRRVSTEKQTEPISSHGYAPPYESSASPSAKHCISCARYPPETAYRPLSAPLPQYGMECRVDLCADCLVSQGLLSHVNLISGLYSADAHERAALTKARDLAVDCVEEAAKELAERERVAMLEERQRVEEELRSTAMEAGAREIGSDGMRSPVRPSAASAGTVAAVA